MEISGLEGRWGGNKWPRRPLGVNYSAEACGHCVKVGLVVLLLKRELDSPEDLGNFSPKKEKNLGELKFARLSASNFCGRVVNFTFYFWLSRFQAKVQNKESLMRLYSVR